MFILRNLQLQDMLQQHLQLACSTCNACVMSLRDVPNHEADVFGCSSDGTSGLRIQQLQTTCMLMPSKSKYGPE